MPRYVSSPPFFLNDAVESYHVATKFQSEAQSTMRSAEKRPVDGVSATERERERERESERASERERERERETETRARERWKGGLGRGGDEG